MYHHPIPHIKTVNIFPMLEVSVLFTINLLLHVFSLQYGEVVLLVVYILNRPAGS